MNRLNMKKYLTMGLVRFSPELCLWNNSEERMKG